MRRPLTIAAFVVLALVPISAQRGGMRASGGSRGVAVAHASGSRAFGGMHAGPSARPSPSFHGNGFGGVHIRTGGFHHCHGCRRGYGHPWYAGYGYAGYYSPYWGWDSSSSYNYDEDQARELALANEMNAVSLEEQRLREQEDRERERDVYSRHAQPREEERAAAIPATALVFRDQHVEEVRNYAIAGGTLWVVTEQAAKKIPLAQLDLPATVKMNDDRGVDFQVPGPTLQLMIVR